MLKIYGIVDMDMVWVYGLRGLLGEGRERILGSMDRIGKNRREEESG